MEEEKRKYHEKKIKEEAINYARPHLNNETKIEVLTVKTEIIVEKTQETIE